MGRTKSPINTELNAEVPLSDDLNVSLNAMTQHRMEIMQRFGDGQPYRHDRIVHEAQFYMAQSVEAMPEADKQLIILKESEPHGDFVGIAEEQPGLHAHAAQQMMRAFLKYLSLKLEPKATTLSLLGKAKLFELVTEDDDDPTELADDGTVAGLTLDDADRMSVRELRQTLHEARETNTARQCVLADKNEKIDLLSTRLEKKSRIQPPEPDEEVKKLRAEVTVLAAKVESTIAVRLPSVLETLRAYCVENMVNTPRDFMAGSACQLESTARSLRSIFNLPDEPIGNAAPSWLTESTPQISGLEV